MTFFDLFVAGMTLFVAGLHAVGNRVEATIAKSSVDGRDYVVQRRGDSQLAADMLGRLNMAATSLIEHLKKKYPEDERVSLLASRYNPKFMSEGTAMTGYTSYTVDKGRRLVMCLRDRSRDNDMEPANVLTYVLIHELTHLATAAVGHPQEFWDNFGWMIREAVEIGVYEAQDFGKSPVTYCGLKLSSSSVSNKALS